MMYTENSYFEWDDDKANTNRIKHGVTFEEATTVFHDFSASSRSDPRCYLSEHRQLIVGQSAFGNLLVVVFTERNDRTRIISARKANRKERRRYEEEI